MKKVRGKVVSGILSAAMMMSITACGGSAAGNVTATETGNNVVAGTSASGSDSAISTESPYAGKGYDLSNPETIVMYVLGDRPADMDMVLAKANEEYFQPNLNTTLDIEFLNWSDYQTKYPLLLSGGEQVDLIYTASWC